MTDFLDRREEEDVLQAAYCLNCGAVFDYPEMGSLPRCPVCGGDMEWCEEEDEEEAAP